MIELTGVSYSYGDRPLFDALDLSLAPGSFHFLTGPSGSGKTTLLKLCYLELAPGQGHVALFGENADDLDRDGVAAIRQRIGIVHQDCQFLDHLPLSENIALPLAVAGRDPEPERGNLAELLAWVDLGDRANALPPELSGGERQRAALARAVIMAPDVILADEPTGNVDWEMGTRLLMLLVELNKLGKTILVATHDLGLIRQAKVHVQARVLRLANKSLTLAGSDL
ncbi:MAG: ATP-binding cassette domain-containing protein [Pseudomonadota bacterium]